ncbi:MAG: tetratricopeptide repeat protein, partial [bacterium]
FRDVFPEAVLWYNTSELLLLGRRDEPIVVRGSRLALLQTPPVATDLEYAYWGGPAQFLSRPGVFLAGFLCGPRGLAALADGAPVYRDDLPILEYATVAVTAGEPREVPAVHALRRHLDAFDAVCAGVSPEVLAEAGVVREKNVGDMIAAAHLRRVDDLKARGDLPGIQAAVAEALKHNPLNGTAQRLMGDVLQRLGRLDEAQASFEEALRIDGADALARRSLAFNLHLAGRVAEAIPHYREALRRRPGDIEIMNGLGGALAQAGQFPEATELFEETLRLRPDFAAARENLERVRRAASVDSARSGHATGAGR